MGIVLYEEINWSKQINITGLFLLLFTHLNDVLVIKHAAFSSKQVKLFKTCHVWSKQKHAMCTIVIKVR
jgi:hypothetical protein